MILDKPVPQSDVPAYIVVFAGMCTVILAALAFEYIGGYQPCKLCLQQREPWYLGIPVAALATLSMLLKWPAYVSRGLMLVTALVLLYSIVLGVHHAGVEWGWWEGPGDCGMVEGGLATNTTDLLRQLNESVPPSCTDASLRVLGLSFAGWNAIVSTCLAALALHTVFKA